MLYTFTFTIFAHVDISLCEWINVSSKSNIRTFLDDDVNVLLGICGVVICDNCVVISGDVGLGKWEEMILMLEERERQKERKGFVKGGCGVNEKNVDDDIVNADIGWEGYRDVGKDDVEEDCSLLSFVVVVDEEHDLSGVVIWNEGIVVFVKWSFVMERGVNRRGSRCFLEVFLRGLRVGWMCLKSWGDTL